MQVECQEINQGSVISSQYCRTLTSDNVAGDSKERIQKEKVCFDWLVYLIKQ